MRWFDWLTLFAIGATVGGAYFADLLILERARPNSITLEHLSDWIRWFPAGTSTLYIGLFFALYFTLFRSAPKFLSRSALTLIWITLGVRAITLLPINAPDIDSGWLVMWPLRPTTYGWETVWFIAGWLDIAMITAYAMLTVAAFWMRWRSDTLRPLTLSEALFCIFAGIFTVGIVATWAVVSFVIVGFGTEFFEFAHTNPFRIAWYALFVVVLVLVFFATYSTIVRRSSRPLSSFFIFLVLLLMANVTVDQMFSWQQLLMLGFAYHPFLDYQPLIGSILAIGLAVLLIVALVVLLYRRLMCGPPLPSLTIQSKHGK